MFNKNAYLQLPQGSACNSLSHHHHHHPLDLTGADEILFHDHGHAMLSGHYLAAAEAPVIDAAAYFNHQDVGGLNGDTSAAMVNTCPRASKKDRHSKIYTSQGPRDRRVRLSIGVARRFFDLQEILGFDKPSKTLDWLLTKSKTAITDLVRTKDQNASKSVVISSPSDCEVDSAEPPLDENGKLLSDLKRKLVVMNDKGSGSKQALNLAKESRVKARARARERTREKMCFKQLNESSINGNGGYDLNPSSIPIHYMNNQLEFCKISGDSSRLHCHPGYELAAASNDQDLIQESSSILIKRKVKHPSTSILGFQQNLFISSSNYGVPSPYNAADNWDFSSFTSQSNICAILDQHKFINSSSNN